MDEPTYKDFMQSIKDTKEDLWNDDIEKQLSKKYSKFLTIKGLVSAKNILLLNAINSRQIHLDDKMHYHFLLHSIPKGQKYKSVTKRKNKLEKIQSELKEKYEDLKKGGIRKPK